MLDRLVVEGSRGRIQIDAPRKVLEEIAPHLTGTPLPPETPGLVLNDPVPQDYLGNFIRRKIAEEDQAKSDLLPIPTLNFGHCHDLKTMPPGAISEYHLRSWRDVILCLILFDQENFVERMCSPVAKGDVLGDEKQIPLVCLQQTYPAEILLPQPLLLLLVSSHM